MQKLSITLVTPNITLKYKKLKFNNMIKWFRRLKKNKKTILYWY